VTLRAVQSQIRRVSQIKILVAIAKSNQENPKPPPD
jgi:hypothetical protein